jgi:hypothetical protein
MRTPAGLFTIGVCPVTGQRIVSGAPPIEVIDTSPDSATWPPALPTAAALTVKAPLTRMFRKLTA